jgi:hypothetical protein
VNTAGAFATAALRAANMDKQRVVQIAVKTGLLGVMGVGIMMIDVRPSFAVCDEIHWTNTNGRCGIWKMCHDIVDKKGLKDKTLWDAEYLNCKNDPQNYK